MTLLEQVRAHPVLHQATPDGTVCYRGGGDGTDTLVLLHGIGSGSGSWIMQLTGLARQCRVLAWDAPGYAGSTPVAAAEPVATDYARRMWAWLDAMDVGRITLVGHSLGALIAAAAAAERPARVRCLTLLAPAQGYARATAGVRHQKRDDRLAMLARLGPQGLGRERGSNLLSPAANAQQVELAQAMMGSVDVGGYAQATHMLSTGDLLADLERVACPVRVASGSADTITPAHGCEAVARHVGSPYLSLGPAGHLCAVEAASMVNALLVEALGPA